MSSSIPNPGHADGRVLPGAEWVHGSDRILYTKTTDSTPNLWIKRPSQSGAQITLPPVTRYLLSGTLTSHQSTNVASAAPHEPAGHVLPGGVPGARQPGSAEDVF